MGFKLFLESHLHASVFPPALGKGGLRDRIYWPLYSKTFGAFVNMLTEKCYPISPDAAEIVVRFFGIESRKVDVVSLGVDTDLFRPPDADTAQQTRNQLRQALGFLPNEVVCIYTGRFSKDKNPICLAEAICKLVAEGKAFRGLFVGCGTAKDVAAISHTPGCVVQPFVPTIDLPPYYWAADVGVWPKQESTSQLDAAACGLPLILSNQIKVLERVDESGLLFEEDNPYDLAQQIIRLSSPETRKRMGENGSQKVRSQISWVKIAQQRLQSFELALQVRNK